ncbi:MAG: hypothetical protein K6F61_04110 [Clostridiales bacterium]|nr:hypothetical protein [Clostridiales bacterium]
MLNIGKTIDYLTNIYSDRSKYTDGMILDNMLACYSARKSALFAGDMDVYEKNTLELGVLRSVALARMGKE